MAKGLKINDKVKVIAGDHKGKEAKIVGIDSETGSIEKGKSADLIVVKDNPLDDLNALKNVSMVIMKGKQIHNPKVKRMKEVDALFDRYL